MLDDSSSSEVNAVILADNEILRVDETITFDAGNSSGNIETYAWDFGDGSVSSEAQTSHQYERPGWYNVTLLVIGKDGNNDTAIVNIGVQYEDIVGTRNIDRMFNIRGQKSIVGNYDIGPNVGDPTMDIDITLDAVVGNFFVRVEIWCGGEPPFDRTPIFSEQVLGTGSSYTKTITISHEDIPEEVAFTDAFIYLEMMIDEGYWSGGTINLQCIFPIDNLTPPTS